MKLFCHCQENPPEKKIKDETDSDSSSLPSLEDEEDKRRGIAQEKNKMEKKHSARAKKSDKGGQRVNPKLILHEIIIETPVIILKSRHC